jgi:putative Mg2+ transporter-C (MgtC) family protein
MDLSQIESFALPLLGAVVAGGLIGFEREWRGRPAGLRTHILVSLASALLMLAAMGQADWAFRALPDENIVTDPTRMAHGVLTGIGFLCAGVIFRAGFSIHGLTTAASLWITSALGLLFGAGLFTLGLVGTVTTVIILVGFKLISRRLPTQVLTDVEVSWRRKGRSPEAQVEALLKQIDPALRPDRFQVVEGGAVVRRSWRIKASSEAELKGLAQQLCSLPDVTDYVLDPRDD